MKTVFYRPDKIRSYNAFINFIVGARGVGKTFSLTETVINDYLKTGKQFLYIRRRVTELEDISKFFDDMIYHEKFEGHTLTVEPDKRGATFKIDGEVCGYARALSVQHYLKSVPFPLIYNILFDEFIIDVGGNKSYLPNEVVDFLEILQSAIRLRNARVYLISNALSVGNPYFNYFDIEIKSTDHIKVVKRIGEEIPERLGEPLIVVEMVHNEPYRKLQERSLFGSLVKGTPYGDYAMNNTFLRDQTSFIKKRSPLARCQYRIRFNSIDFGIWFDYDDNSIYVDNKAIDPNTPYAVVQFNEHSPSSTLVDRSHHRMKEIKQAFNNSLLWFNNEQCYGAFKDLLWLIGC